MEAQRLLESTANHSPACSLQCKVSDPLSLNKMASFSLAAYTTEPREGRMFLDAECPVQPCYQIRARISTVAVAPCGLFDVLV